MSQNYTSAIANNIKNMREERNWSQQDLADKLDVQRPRISNWENEKSEPTASELANLAKIFNISTEIILGNSVRSNQVIVIDSSVFMKRPLILDEVINKFDEVIIPDVAFHELNTLKDKAKDNVKQRAWLAMMNIEKHKNNPKVQIREAKFQEEDINDAKIAKVAIARAKKSISDKVYMLSNDIFFGLYIRDLPNLEVLTSQKYDEVFTKIEANYDIAKTQLFLSEVSNKNLGKVKAMNITDVDINHIDSSCGQTALIKAVANRDYPMVDYLLDLKSIDINAKDKEKYRFTPLLKACQIKDLKLITTLVEKGADIDMGSEGVNHGNTPLMVCAWGGFYEGVAYLSSLDISFNQQDNNGFTALHKACMKGNYNISKLLIDKVDVRIKDRENKTAIQHVDVRLDKNRSFLEIFKK